MSCLWQLQRIGYWLIPGILLSVDVKAAPPTGTKFDPVTAGYKLTFDDEFRILSASNEGIHTTWETKFYWMNDVTRRDFLDPRVCGLGRTPFSIRYGTLKMQLLAVNSVLKRCEPVDVDYFGGHLDTYHSFAQKYGYFEVRARVNGAYGTIFSFWLLPRDGTWPPEIDVTEILGRSPTYDNVTNHTNEGGEPTSDTFKHDIGKVKPEFHTYGALWTSGSIIFYMDGQKIATTPTRSDEHKPFYIVMEFHTGRCGDKWADCPKTVRGLTATAEVSWVRVWRRMGAERME